MLKIQNKTTKRLRIALIILFLVILFANSFPFFQGTVYFGNTAVKDSVYVFDWKATDEETGKEKVYDYAYYADKEDPTAETSKIKVYIDEELQNEFEANPETLNIYYWGGENRGDAECITTEKTVKKSFEDLRNGEERTYYEYDALIPKDAEYFQFHAGDRYFNGNLLKYYTATDLFLEVTTITDNPQEQGALSTVALSSAIFFVIPIIGFLFAAFDKARNFKNIAGILCSILGVFAIVYIVGPEYLSIGSLAALLFYLAAFLVSMFGIFARYLVSPEKENTEDNKES